jgi:hypothetical protein
MFMLFKTEQNQKSEVASSDIMFIPTLMKTNQVFHKLVIVGTGTNKHDDTVTFIFVMKHKQRLKFYFCASGMNL